MTKPTLIWIHEDTLNPNHPIFTHYAGAPAVFIFDDAMWSRHPAARKRIMFIYESVLELPVTIHKGDTLAILREQLKATNTTALAIPHTVDTRIRTLAHQLESEGIPVDWVRAPSLADKVVSPMPRRFFQFWNRVKKQVMHKSDAG